MQDTTDNLVPPPYAMDSFTTSITAERFLTLRKPGRDDYMAQVRTQGLPDAISVELPREAPRRDADGHSIDSLPVANCRDCHEPLTGDNESQVSRERTCTVTGQEHVPVPIPLSWANNASIELDHEHDLVRVGISVADPRGGFCLEIRNEHIGDPCEAGCKGDWVGEPTNEYVHMLDGQRCPTCEGTGFVNWRYELRMSVPHDTDGQPHAPLTDLNGRGYYKIGY